MVAAVVAVVLAGVDAALTMAAAAASFEDVFATYSIY